MTRTCLLADTELFLSDDSAVAVDVLALQVVEQATTLTNQHFQSALCGVVLVVVLEVLEHFLAGSFTV